MLDTPYRQARTSSKAIIDDGCRCYLLYRMWVGISSSDLSSFKQCCGMSVRISRSIYHICNKHRSINYAHINMDMYL